MKKILMGLLFLLLTIPGSLNAAGADTTETKSPIGLQNQQSIPSLMPFENRGWEVMFSFDLGILTGGLQKETGEAVLYPKPESISKLMFGLGSQYFWRHNLGVEFNFDFYVLTDADKEGYKSYSLYNEFILRAGAVYVPFIKNYSTRVMKWQIKGGLNYDLFKLDDDFKSSLSAASSNLIFYTGYAKGFGYYFKTDLEWVLQKGYLFSVGIGYEFLNPKFSQATKSIDSQAFTLMFGIGYKIK